MKRPAATEGTMLAPSEPSGGAPPTPAPPTPPGTGPVILVADTRPRGWKARRRRAAENAAIDAAIQRLGWRR